MQSEMSRIILGWYMRFDVFAGLMGGFETVLSREWFSSTYEFFQRQIESEPTRLKWKIDASIAKHRLLATDMSLLLVRMGKGELSIDQFMSENSEIGRRIEDWKTKMDPALQDKRFIVTDFSGARPRDPDSIVDPYLPGIIYNGPLWVMNLAMIDVTRPFFVTPWICCVGLPKSVSSSRLLLSTGNEVLIRCSASLSMLCSDIRRP